MKRIELTASQAEAFAAIYRRKLAAEQEWQTALTIAGVDPDRLAGGNLDADPHLMVKEDE